MKQRIRWENKNFDDTGTLKNEVRSELLLRCFRYSPVHSLSLPANPGLQVQRKLPMMLVQ